LILPLLPLVLPFSSFLTSLVEYRNLLLSLLQTSLFIRHVRFPLWISKANSLIWGGGISFVYEVHPRIVVKVPKSGEFEREQFRKEREIYQIFSRNPPCPSIVQCFLVSENGIFLEYMRYDFYWDLIS